MGGGRGKGALSQSSAAEGRWDGYLPGGDGVAACYRCGAARGGSGGGMIGVCAGCTLPMFVCAVHTLWNGRLIAC